MSNRKRRLQEGNEKGRHERRPKKFRFWVYLEENVRVTEKGLEWLSQPQMEIRLIHAN